MVIEPSLKDADVMLIVPLNVGLAKSALVAIAVEMLSNSVSNSEPRMILPVFPLGRLSLASKSVVFV